jgi:hypothetical protein
MAIPTITPTEIIETNAIRDALLQRARAGSAPRVLTPTEHEAVDHAERLAGLTDAAQVAAAGSGGGQVKK